MNCIVIVIHYQLHFTFTFNFNLFDYITIRIRSNEVSLVNIIYLLQVTQFNSTKICKIDLGIDKIHR